MGSVVSGDLNLVASPGEWKNASGIVIPKIADYKVVPGDTLTYTQPLTVTLTGDLMVAQLAGTGAEETNGFGETVSVSGTTLKDAKIGAVLPAKNLVPSNSGKVMASTTFTFKESATARNATAAVVDLSGIGYNLVQQAHANSNGK